MRRSLVLSNSVTYVSTKNWNTSVFSIQRGVFQGDTLSPLLFNLAINPLLAYLSTSEYCGYSAQLQAANSVGLPPVETAIYMCYGPIPRMINHLVGTEQS